MKAIALFDLDGTLCDFDGAMRRDLLKLQVPGEQVLLSAEDEDHYPHIAARRDLIKRQPSWWSNLEPLTDGFELLRVVRAVGFKVHICTRASTKIPDCWRQKIEWISKHVPDVPKITITQDKGLIYGRVLVDDWPPYVKAWLKHRPRGLVLMPDRSWNREFRHPQVTRIVCANSSSSGVRYTDEGALSDILKQYLPEATK